MAVSTGFSLLLVVSLIHIAGIYLFTGGFLLTRLALSGTSTCTTCSRQSNDLVQLCHTSPKPTHSRAIVLIIDALRFDFISPHPPNPPSPFHHNVLTVPTELTKRRPMHSFVLNAYADPPTTTLQRIKGLTTGSLPTFVDLGNNFGASSIREDSIIYQLRAASKKIAFMGDDTWMSVFPDSFETNMTFPFDSFNVEDLHTVDEGVIAHLFPLLENRSKPFDFLIGHFLGVDHVGHRVGPDHPSMRAKLLQMNDVLARVVDLMDDDTLLVVLGDHGMDRSGDHGGDGELETSTGLWIYSKGPALVGDTTTLPPSLVPSTIFPGTTLPNRSVQQIDLVPTLSLLLGLPIPYNNLGTIIPELFARGNDNLHQALQLNRVQIRTYLDAYRSSSAGRELDASWLVLQRAWRDSGDVDLSESERLVAVYEFNRLVLATCRAMWAQFNSVRMGMGLFIMGIGIVSTWIVYSSLAAVQNQWNSWLSSRIPTYFYSTLGGIAFGLVCHLITVHFISSITLWDHIAFFAALVLSITILLTSFRRHRSFRSLQVTPILILLLHTLSFFSNSFTFWEDHIVPYLLLSSLFPSILKGFSAPTPRLRNRILGFSLLFSLCVRLMSISTVCREEQQPYCHVTFYTTSKSSAPLLARLLSIPCALAIPPIIERFLAITRSEQATAHMFLKGVLRPALVASALTWLMEWVVAEDVMDGFWGRQKGEWDRELRGSRSWLAWFVFVGVGVIGTALWWMSPVCMDIVDEGRAVPSFQNEVPQPPIQYPRPQRTIKIIGFANAFGAPYLVFWCIPLSLMYMTTQLTGQLVLGLAVVALIAHLEIVDSVRDVHLYEQALHSSRPSALLRDLQTPYSSASVKDNKGKMEDIATIFNRPSPPVTFADVVPLCLLGLHTFFCTGHQAVISSLQWKSAFVLTKNAVYIPSFLTVMLNSLGGLLLVGIGAPLFALWNRAPLERSRQEGAGGGQDEPAVSTDSQIRGESILAALGVMLYHATLLLGTAVSGAILRRHLMVWKVFAPRFMMAVCSLIVVDLGVLIGVGLGVERVAVVVGGMFRAVLEKGT